MTGVSPPRAVRCPTCNFEVRVPVERGETECTYGHAFEYALFDPAPPAPRSRPTSRADSGATPCAIHAGNAAVASCERCGTFICALCRVEQDGATLCMSCFERREKDTGGNESGGTRIRSLNQLAYVSGVASLFLFPLAVLAGPLAMVLAVLGWRQERKLDEPYFRFRGKVGALLGVVGLLLGVLFWVGMFEVESRAHRPPARAGVHR
jgi:hypothetical protein